MKNIKAKFWHVSFPMLIVLLLAINLVTNNTIAQSKNSYKVIEVKNQITEVLDLWYGYVGGNGHLVHHFAKNGQPNMDYLTAVRARFGQWILDLCQKPYDQNWLNYQHEIAKRHHSTKKNKTDGVDAAPIIHLRYMVAFIYPITATIKSF